MKKITRRGLSIVCAITMVVTSMTGLSLTNVMADSTTTLIKADDANRAALLAEVANADYNFALGKRATVSNLTPNDGGTDLSIITNGKFETANSKTTIIETGRGNTTDFQWVQVDLGNAYDTSKINRIAVQYKTNGSCPKSGYKISYSINGLDFVDVATVGANTGSNNQIFLDEIALTTEQAEAIPFAKFIRVTSTKISDTSAYGMQIKGMAVLTDGGTKVSDVEYQEVLKLDNPASLTVTSSAYGQLEYSFEAAEGHDDYTYYAYIDNVQQSGTVTPGETYTVTGLTGGEHEVMIMSVKGGLTSDGLTEKVTVTDTKSLLTTERNIALGKNATASSIRENDSEKNITDGNLTNLFRTLQTELNSSIVIDLGQNYRLGAIERTVALYAKDRYPKSYTIDYSLNGIDFVTVAEATGNDILQTVEIDPSGCTLQAVRYVRFNLSDAFGVGFGFQMNELGVIAKEDADLTPVEVEGLDTLDNPASLTLTSSDYCQMEYTFEAAEGHDDYAYYVFVDGALAREPVMPSEEYVVTKLSAGTHSVKVVSYKDGFVSKGVEATVEVRDYSGLFTDVRNIAVGKSATASSIRNEDLGDLEGEELEAKKAELQARITDGDVKTLFRTDINEANSYIVIDLGKDYGVNALERVVINFNTGRNPKTYTVECSADGEEYQQVAAASDVVDAITSVKIDTTEYTLSAIRYIKLNMSLPATENTGYQIYELAVIENYVDINNATVTFEKDQKYTGQAIQPDVKVEYEGNTLTAGQDYEVIYGENTAVGTGTIKINGTGRYNGTIDETFTIGKQEMTNVEVSASFDANNNLVVSAVNGTVALEEKVDYTYEISIDQDGNLVVTLAGIGDNYTGTTDKTILLADRPVNEAANLAVSSTEINKITVSFATPDKVGAASQIYDVYIDDALCDENVQAGEYTYTEQTAGTHTVKVVAVLGEKKSEGVTAEVTVAGMDISSDKAKVSAAEIAPVYSGNEQTVTVSVEYDGVALTEDVDYVVEYSDNVNAGTAKYKVTGIGLYEGSVEGEFTIVSKPITDSSVSVETSFANKELVIVVKDGSTELVKDVDYKYTAVTDAAGNITVTVTGLGANYAGTVTKTIAAKDNPNVEQTTASTTPAKVTVAKVKSVKVKNLKGKKASITWKKLTGVKGYKIRYSTSKKFKKAKTVTIKKNVAKSTIKKLKKNTVYYVQVRAYKVVNGKTYLGNWSARKKIKIKK